MSVLINLLNDLGKDAELAAEFEQDPDGIGRRYGLNDEELRALTSGDVDAVRKLSGLDNLKRTNSTIKPYA